MSDNFRQCELCNKQVVNGFCEDCERQLMEVEFEACVTVAERIDFLARSLKPKRTGMLRVLGYKKDELNNDKSWEELVKGREGAAEIVVDALTKWLEFYKYNSKLACENLVEPENWRLSFLPTDIDTETAWLTMFWVSPNREATCIKVILGRPFEEFPLVSSVLNAEQVEPKMKPLWSELYPSLTENLEQKAQ